MKIPKRFKLVGHTIDVQFDPKLVQESDATGMAYYRFNKIVLQGEEGYTDRPQSKIEQDFCHELMHFLLYYGECKEIDKLYKNEVVVDRLSCLLHQVLSTMEYDESKGES